LPDSYLMSRRAQHTKPFQWMIVAGVAALLALAALLMSEPGSMDMRMTAIEKYFVNRPGHTRAVAQHAARLLEHVGIQPGWRYLDVGCGVGAAARHIAQTRPLDVTGIDVDPQQIQAARAGPVRPNVRFLTMDATRLEFGDASFDVVATSMTTHHIPQWQRAFREMARVLRPGGYLIYGDLVAPSWMAAAGARLIPFAGFPSPNALDSLAAENGLVEVYRYRSVAKIEVVWRKAGQQK